MLVDLDLLARKLLGEGALSAAFIPLYAQAVKHEHTGKASDISANDFAAASVNLLCAILTVLTVVGEILLLLAVWLTKLSVRVRIVDKLAAPEKPSRAIGVHICELRERSKHRALSVPHRSSRMS